MRARRTPPQGTMRDFGLSTPWRGATRRRLRASARLPAIWPPPRATWMNASGGAVAAVARYFGVPPQQILVAHDEADLPAGCARFKCGGGEAGHNGLISVSQSLASRDYWRLRLGVDKGGQAGDISRYVLQPPGGEERALIDGAIERALAAWPHAAAGDFERAMLLLHSRR